MKSASLNNQRKLKEQTERILKPVISPGQPIEPVMEALFSLTLPQQQYVYHWLAVIAISNIELAYHFGLISHQAFQHLPEKAVNVWVSQTLKRYDREGLYPAVRFLQDLDGFTKSYTRLKHQVTFEEMVGVLTPYLRGLSGRDLKLKKGSLVYTDTETMYLPASLTVYRDKEKNRSLYKAMACFMWAQTWFGTFKKEAYSALSLEQRLAQINPSEQARVYQVFLILENVRLMSSIKRELPGLYKEMSALSPAEEEVSQHKKDSTWEVLTQPLKQAGATVEHTLVALSRYFSLRMNLPNIPYLGQLELGEIELQIQKRGQKLKQQIVDKMEQGQLNKNQLEEQLDEFNNSDSNQSDSKDKQQLEALINQLKQDVQNLEPDWFNQLSGEGKNSSEQPGKLDNAPRTTPPKHDQDETEFFYDEWDFERQQYREAWCRLSEKTVIASSNDFVLQTKQKYRRLIGRIRKAFEQIRDQSALLRNQTDGQDIDIDAVVRMQASRQAGEEISDRLYLRKSRDQRSLAALLLIDLSGSTKGWINQLEKESLVLIVEALEILGDQYAIYGFSGLTRQRCEIYPVKPFWQDSKALTLKKIGGLNAKDYTRMGVAIRHSTNYLKKVEAKHKLLIVLSDGKPDDYDGYKGEYGLQDTRRSLDEAHHLGIKSFAITIDQQAQSYLPRLFGPHRYTVLNDVNKLPQSLTDIYRRLTH